MLIHITLVFCLFGALLFSLQVFGPIRVFERALLSKQEEPEVPAPFTLRKGDYFKSFATLLQDVLNKNRVTEDPEQDPE